MSLDRQLLFPTHLLDAPGESLLNGQCLGPQALAHPRQFVEVHSQLASRLGGKRVRGADEREQEIPGVRRSLKLALDLGR
ncbi:MAG: hypothetical protein M3071_18275 [Actinomycetota bacterium]|nr:hypothetical protein [Actinomycetota bacterium]